MYLTNKDIKEIEEFFKKDLTNKNK